MSSYDKQTHVSNKPVCTLCGPYMYVTLVVRKYVIRHK